MSDINFEMQTVASGANVVFGEAGSTNATIDNRLSSQKVHTIDLQSAGAGVATITFDSGNGYTGALTQDAGTVVDYYQQRCKNIKVTIATADCDVILTSSMG